MIFMYSNCGNGAAIVLVLFILLIIILGAWI
ncbi:MAG: sporulation protein YjcZ [Bacilli bacterium]|nr:sporulation protein YjcZ [Bacilli bacterium]